MIVSPNVNSPVTHSHPNPHPVPTKTHLERSNSQPTEFSVAFLTHLIDGIADPIFVQDAQHRWILCNDAFCNFMGYSREELVGQSHSNFLPKADADAILEIDEQVLAVGIPNLNEKFLTDANGYTQLITTHRSRFEDETGRPFLVGTMRVIGNCHAVDTQVYQSQQILQQILDSLPQSIFWKDRHSVYLGCNRNFAKDAGLDSSKEIVGKTDYDLPWNKEEADFYRQCDSQVMNSNQPQLHIIEPQHQADGKQICLDTSKVPLYDADGKVIGILGTYQDITQQKQTELALQQLNEKLEHQVKQRTNALRCTVRQLQKEIQERQQFEAELQEKEQFLRTVYNGVEHLIFTIDVSESGEFRYAGWNEPTTKATGVSNDHAIGKTPREVFGEVEGENFEIKYSRCLQAEVPMRYEENLIFDGQENWWMTTITPIHSLDGKIVRLIGTTFNITDRKQAESQLDQKTHALESTLWELQRTQIHLIQSEKMSSLGQLVAGVAHEINNPICFVYGNLKHVKDYTQDLLELIELYQINYFDAPAEIQDKIASIDLDFLRDDLPKIIDSMKGGADRIKNIVLSLRNFSRMDESGLKFVNLHEGIDSTLILLKSRLKKQEHRAEIEVILDYGDLPNIKCYAGQLNQVFMNILTNAIDAIEDLFVSDRTSSKHHLDRPINNNGKISIRTEVLDNNWVSIRIRDNGLGMTESVRQRIFDPFFTTKPIGKGTGMGLSICYQIVTDRHGGTLECISEPGSGTELVIQIPQQQS
jgi:PAS domain S-box-containing protein